MSRQSESGRATGDGTARDRAATSDVASDEVEAVVDAYEALERAEDAVSDVGTERVEAVADAYDRAMSLLDRYQGSATGTGDFGAYVEFEEEFVTFVERLDDDLPERDAFERANEVVDRRRLRERDFERARETLEPAAAVAETLDERKEAERRYRKARHAAERRVDELDDRIADLERLRRLGDADLDAPVERLREPIEAYNEAVTESFERFEADTSARDVLSFVETTDAYPLVRFRTPPRELCEYVEQYPAGEHPVPKLLEYADYSGSKLDHYVDDPAELKTRVAVHQTYLERLGPDPLTVSWPPPSAGQLRYRAQELVAVVGRFADDETVEEARNLRTLAERDGYGRLRTAAEAQTELDAGERERLREGDVAAELETRQAERESLAETLAEYPS